LETHIHLDNLSKYFGEVKAVDGLSMEIGKGEFITFLGPSGSGKTTTLLMIAGFEEPSSGNILLNGESILRKPPYKRDLGMVFQNYALFPHMTVADNIAFPLQMRKVNKIETDERINDALQLVRLAGYGDRYPNQLSGGQQQRIALARALVFNPSVLLMDEPLGALDRKLREEMKLEIRNLHHQIDVTVIYVTHDQEEALVLSDRIAVMNHGKVVQLGTPTDLYEHPAEKFVADFIGESNFIEGKVESLNKHDRTCEVRTKNGLLISGSYKENISNGQTVHMAVRPSRITILNDHEQTSNSFEGTIREIIYLGETTKYEIELSKDDVMVMKRINRLGTLQVNNGDNVKIGWDTEDTKVLL